jgi:hypothetical protein
MNDIAKKEPYVGSVRFFKHIILLLAGLAIIIPTVIAVTLALRSDGAAGPEIVNTIHGRGIIAAPGNIDEILATEKVGDGYYTSSMNNEWDFTRWNRASSNAFVENHASNTKTVYFDVTLDATGELVYSSPFIPVGAALKGFALDAQIPAGNHTATVTYHLVDENYENITTASVAVLLRISR